MSTREHVAGNVLHRRVNGLSCRSRDLGRCSAQILNFGSILAYLGFRIALNQLQTRMIARFAFIIADGICLIKR